jgi:hypothetical protein
MNLKIIFKIYKSFKTILMKIKLINFKTFKILFNNKTKISKM